MTPPRRPHRRRAPASRPLTAAEAEREERRRLVARIGANRPSSIDDGELYRESNREGGPHDLIPSREDAPALALAALVLAGAIAVSAAGALN